MPTFRYRAYSPAGDFAEGAIEAVSQDVANDLLWARGLTPFEMKASSAGGQKWWQREIFTGSGTRLADLASFTRQVATLKSAGLPLGGALRILAQQASVVRLRAIVDALLADILNGATLSEAMQKQPEMFPADYVSMVRAGEIGGADSEVFVDLADLLERRLDIRGRI